MQFPASAVLKPYVQGYWIFSVDRDVTNEVFYPSGFVDFAVNISSGSAITLINGRPVDMPKVEVLGQITQPTRLTATKGTAVLIARIYPHANSLFFPNPISDFTNHSIDLSDVFGEESNDFYCRLMESDSTEQKVKALDTFLVQRLEKNKTVHHKVIIIEQICRHIRTEGESFSIKTLSDQYGISERYIQKLFLDNVGIKPKSFSNIHRFNKSLQLIQTADLPLTSIAYDCGYYDQAHFIKEFKKFTGLTPSEVRALQAVG